jgi:hypothetical protein
MGFEGKEEGEPMAEPSPQAMDVDALFAEVRRAVLEARRTPLATYRVQLHQGFDLAQAKAQVPYLRALGISDLYTSPLLEAAPGSAFGETHTDDGPCGWPAQPGRDGWMGCRASFRSHARILERS